MTQRPTTELSGRTATVLVPVILAGLSMLGPFSIDTPFPAFPAMGDDLSASSAEMQLVVSSYLIAFGLMSPFHGPLSDALGRRPVIIGGVAVYAAASIGCALSTDLAMLLVFRVLQGLSAGGGVIVSRTVIRDVFDGAEAQRLMSRVMMIFGLAPAVAPVVGGLLLQLGAWPVIFWFLTGVGFVLVTVVAVFLPETHPPELRVPLRVRSLVGSLVGVSRSSRFHQVAWTAALSFAGQFLYIGAASIFVVELLGKGELDYWIVFVPMIAGVMLGATASSRAAGRLSGPTLVSGALAVSVVGALVNVVLALPPTTGELPWAVVGPALIAIGTAAAYPALQLMLLDMFPTGRGAAVSVFTFFTLLLNGVAATALAPLVTRSVLSLALASTAFVVAGGVCWLRHLAVARRDRTPVLRT
jgi:DHA1 family bicyclomycin/chloramphenicol resistance-like MFS transporter